MKKVNVMLRIDPELHKEVKEAAGHDHSSLNGWIQAAVEQRLDRLAVERDDLYNQIKRIDESKGGNR